MPRVGELYKADRTAWPESPRLSLSQDEVELALFYQDPTPQEINDVRSGSARFALLHGDHALILAFRFGRQPWSDVPWQAAGQTHPAVGLVESEPDGHLLVRVALVDATNGIVKALRVTSWGPAFAAEVRAAIAAQLRHGSTAAQGQAEVDGWYRRYRNTSALVQAAQATTSG